MNQVDDRMDLKPLDPGTGDSGFWLRFHGEALAQAREELARRRLAGDWSIAETVFQWRKALVPMTLLAAALAGVFVLGIEEPVSPLSPVALEDALVENLQGDPIPTVLGRVEEMGDMVFMASAGGF